MTMITVLGTHKGFAILFEPFPERFEARLTNQPLGRKTSLRPDAAFTTKGMFLRVRLHGE